MAQPLCLAARSAYHNDDAWRWHECFGHLNFEALKQLGNKEIVQGMPRVKHVEQFYDTYVLTKLVRQGEAGACARRPLRPRDTGYT